MHMPHLQVRICWAPWLLHAMDSGSQGTYPGLALAADVEQDLQGWAEATAMRLFPSNKGMSKARVTGYISCVVGAGPAARDLTWRMSAFVCTAG